MGLAMETLLPYPVANALQRIWTPEMAIAKMTLRAFFGKLARAVSNPVPCWEDYLRQTR